MFKPPHATFFFDTSVRQCPEILLRMHCPEMLYLIEGLCMSMLSTFSLVVEHHNTRLRSLQKAVTSAMPYGPVYEGTRLPFQVDLERCKMSLSQVDMLMRFAEMLNQTGESYLVGMESHTHALIYSTLRHMHEYRVQQVRASIVSHGPHFGSETGWFKNRYDTHVRDWPKRFNFEPLTWTPLPHEDIVVYAPEVATWNASKSQI